ncbi:MAG: 16S rRNA (cytosine1402-N4)-methyltransferase [Candidatus Azotimanducaceae bacterium]|jgi:16S rRNA (cytosine1402-N4)-methyltransferase
MSSEHETVMRQEAVDALVTKPEGVFVDCTYGRGGHTAEILKKLDSRGRLLVIDKDLVAIEHARFNLGNDQRVSIHQGSFSELANFLGDEGLTGVDGVLMDLGVSSPQLEEAERGFSFNRNGPLDMRMDQSIGQTASEWLMETEEKDISYVLWKYGEEKFCRRIARQIVAARKIKAIDTTHDLVGIIEEGTPRKDPNKHPATRSFQAIRIYINQELADLEQGLKTAVETLNLGGRLVVISFHSLEDRIVKRYMRDLARGEKLPDKLPIRDSEIKRTLKLVGKAAKPSVEEVTRNRRSRSSIMRVAEKL